MIKNKKNIMILILLLVAFYLVITIIFSLPKGKKYKNTAFIGDFTKVEVKSGIINVYNNNEFIDKQSTKFYFKNEEIDGSILTRDSGSNGGDYSYYALDKKGNALDFDLGMFGYTADMDLKFKKTDYAYIKDSNEVREFCKQNNIAIGENTNIEQIVVNNFDVDDDNNNEDIYSVGLIENGNKYISFVFMSKDGKYYLIDQAESDYNSVNGIRFRFTFLVDFNKDDNYEFVVRKSMSEYGPNYYELYNFNGTSFNKIGGE